MFSSVYLNKNSFEFLLIGVLFLGDIVRVFMGDFYMKFVGSFCPDNKGCSYVVKENSGN